MTDVTARYLLEQAAKGREITDAMVAEAGMSADAEESLVVSLNGVGRILDAGGPGARRYALALATEAADALAAGPSPRVRRRRRADDADEEAAGELASRIRRLARGY